jgi:hypothetical protein
VKNGKIWEKYGKSYIIIIIYIYDIVIWYGKFPIDFP